MHNTHHFNLIIWSYLQIQEEEDWHVNDKHLFKGMVHLKNT